MLRNIFIAKISAYEVVRKPYLLILKSIFISFPDFISLSHFKKIGKVEKDMTNWKVIIFSLKCIVSHRQQDEY